MTRGLVIGMGAAAALLVSGCRNEGERTEPAPQTEQARPIDDAEQVNPHTMGGTGGAGTQNEPDSTLEVGPGNESSQHEEPLLQDEERPPAEDPNAR